LLTFLYKAAAVAAAAAYAWAWMLGRSTATETMPQTAMVCSFTTANLFYFLNCAAGTPWLLAASSAAASMQVLFRGGKL
jgi:hypothetical protein